MCTCSLERIVIKLRENSHQARAWILGCRILKECDQAQARVLCYRDDALELIYNCHGAQSVVYIEKKKVN